MDKDQEIDLPLWIAVSIWWFALKISSGSSLPLLPMYTTYNWNKTLPPKSYKTIYKTINTHTHTLLLCKGSNTLEETDGLIPARKTARKRHSRTVSLVFLNEPISNFLVQIKMMIWNKEEWENSIKHYFPISGIWERNDTHTQKDWIVMEGKVLKMKSNKRRVKKL